MEIKQGSACFPRFPKFLTVALMLIETEQSLVAAWLSGLRPALSRGIAPAHHAWLGTEAAPGTLEGWACGTRSIRTGRTAGTVLELVGQKAPGS